MSGSFPSKLHKIGWPIAAIGILGLLVKLSSGIMSSEVPGYLLFVSLGFLSFGLYLASMGPDLKDEDVKDDEGEALEGKSESDDDEKPPV